ncbi:hypothetical protein AB2B38_000215 [Balneola sp. MJW-20]|uniref:translocation/assembly module TamB domain-containing protein n=1 Tax=Gracilimonas aurantiaca TaxID=3234185 RepID=UPI00346568DE
MAYLRLLYRSWSTFWTFIGVFITTVVVVLLAVLSALQLGFVKNLMADKVEEVFNQQFEGVLSIGKVDGFLPFSIELQDVDIYPDSSSFESVVYVENVSAGIDLLALVNNRIILNGVNLQSPEIYISTMGDASSIQAFQLRSTALTEPDPQDSLLSSDKPILDLLIPSLIVENGVIKLRNRFDADQLAYRGDSLTFRLNYLNTYLEYSENQRILDIESLEFSVPELELQRADILGQIYNDEETLEMNSFSVSLARSRLVFNAEARDVNLLNDNIGQQLMEAYYELNLREGNLNSENLNRIFPLFPAVDRNIFASIEGEGTLDSLWFDNLEFTLGESFFLASGALLDIGQRDRIGYDFNIDDARFETVDISSFGLPLDSLQLDALSKVNFRGSLRGNQDTAKTDIWLSSNRGEAHIDGKIRLAPIRDLDLNITADSLDLGGLISDDIQNSRLNLEMDLNSSTLDYQTAVGSLRLLSSGSVDRFSYDSLDIGVELDNGFIQSDLALGLYGSVVTGSLVADLTSDINEFNLQGTATKLPVKRIIDIPQMQEAVVDLDYGLQISGNNLDNITGRTNLDIINAVVGEEILGNHQLYLDFTGTPDDRRSLRFTSTAFDATVEGQYNPTELIDLYAHWKDFFRYRFEDEILLDNPSLSLSDTLQTSAQNITWSSRLKDLKLLRTYIPSFPEIRSSVSFTGNAEINPQRLSFNSRVYDPSFTSGDLSADSILVQATGGFRYDSSLKDFSLLNISGDLGLFDYNLFTARNLQFLAKLNRDSLSLSTNIAQLADDARFNLSGEGILTDSLIRFSIDEFDVGTDEYAWDTEGRPVAVYDRQNKLTLQDLLFTSGDQFISVDGTYSTNPTDSVNYLVNGLELERLSDVINGRINFSGLFNGNFTTRSLTRIPSIQGNISVEKFMLDDQIAGDVILNSNYNQELDQFDTRITVYTDSAKYPSYFRNNDRLGLDFEINGYVKAPGAGINLSEVDSLYAFDINFRNIDMWILPFIGPKIFNEASGNGSGKGKFWGTLDDYDFDVNFDIGQRDAVYFRPNFLDTYYYAQGPIRFNRREGLEFQDVFIIDPSGGLATLSGTFDFNDFQMINYFDLRVEMDEFQFLNSEFDPTLPFYGNAYGSSVVTITGTNINPVMRTVTPMQISDFSEIGIPLVEETEVSEDNKLIRFVESFDLPEDSSGQRDPAFGSQQSIDPTQLTFAERFTLDLTFEAQDPMTVRLIFDPVTNDAVTANGTGRIRITLEDQQVNMYGQFNITDGRYQFVSGDIFTRRFELEPGGTIIWNGPPDNARLNLNAFYRARPDINTLTSLRGELRNDETQRVRVPVELVLSITGTLDSIENEFFFRLPDTFDPNINSTLQTQIAALNRDQDEKLIQATSFLLMGDFIPVSNSSTSRNTSFGNNLSGSAAVLNPLLSNQVISPLLSNQINSLLNSDVSSLDVDFNLNTYNQVDLGVALRLYNDKLILRREGQVYSQNNINIGDIGATYRINRTFSVTAFHRQDPTFGNLNTSNSTNDTQDINGVGVEARFSFNTWKQFFRRLGRPFRKLFGIKEKTEEEITENREENPS